MAVIARTEEADAIGYLVNVSAGCSISFGANVVSLHAGWNIFGWR
ncbi:MAG: hypothetical protein ACE5IZ_04310 [Dehalococcoidia bacterium]